MKNLKSLKQFKSEKLEINKTQQSNIFGGKTAPIGDTSKMQPTQNTTECGDCNRLAKTDHGLYDDPNVPYNVVRVAGVDAQDCHF